MNSLLETLLETVFGLLSFAALLRFLLQVTGAPWKNPVSEFALSLTEFALKHMRRYLRFRGTDYSPLLWAWFLEALFLTLSMMLVQGVPLADMLQFVPWILVSSVIAMMRHALYLLMGAVFLLAVLSWINPYSPAMAAVDALTRPFLVPLRQFIPLLGTVDLTPLLLMVIFQLTLTILVGGLEMLAQRLM